VIRCAFIDGALLVGISPKLTPFNWSVLIEEFYVDTKPTGIHALTHKEREDTRHVTFVCVKMV
jgi:hypothetical protein